MTNKTILYLSEVSPLNDDKIFEKYYNLMPKLRQEKINFLRFRKDKIQSLGVGILLQKALSDFNISGFDNDIEIDIFGKPNLTNSNIKFNLSHSNQMVICAISKTEVGCDIEKKHEIDEKLSKKVFTENEINWFNGDLNKFFRLWSLKESYLKYLGTGFSKEANSFEISFFDKPKVCDEPNCNFFEGREGDYFYACATQDSEIEIKKINL